MTLRKILLIMSTIASVLFAAPAFANGLGDLVANNANGAAYSATKGYWLNPLTNPATITDVCAVRAGHTFISAQSGTVFYNGANIPAAWFMDSGTGVYFWDSALATCKFEAVLP